MFKKLLHALKKRRKNMAEENQVNQKVENGNEEIKKDETTESVNETNEEIKENKQENEQENKQETSDTSKEEDTGETEEITEEVQETQDVGNGIRVEDLVTKDMLADRLSALEAKFDAVIKENEDLKNALSQKSEELNGMKDKYENKDFGNMQKQGMMEKDRYANSSFDEYSKQFM